VLSFKLKTHEHLNAYDRGAKQNRKV